MTISSLHIAINILLLSCSNGARSNIDIAIASNVNLHTPTPPSASTACAEAAKDALTHVGKLRADMDKVLENCESSRPNCISRRDAKIMEDFATEVVLEALEVVYETCEEGQVPADIGEGASRYGMGSTQFVPQLKTAAPELQELLEDTLPPQQEPTSADIITQETRSVLEAFELSDKDVTGMPLRMQLYCNGGTATMPDGQQFLAYTVRPLTDEELTSGLGEPQGARQGPWLEGIASWQDLDIADPTSVRKIFEAATTSFRVRGDGRACDHNQRTFAFRVDRLGEQGTPITASHSQKGGGLFKSNGQNSMLGLKSLLPKLTQDDVFTLVRCSPENAAEEGYEMGKHCFMPTNPAERVEHGFLQTRSGQLGICLPKADPEAHLRKLSCAAQALAFHMNQVQTKNISSDSIPARPVSSMTSVPNMVPMTNKSSMVQIRSKSTWAVPIVAIGGVMKVAFKATALAIEISMTICDYIVAMTVAFITYLATLSLDVAFLPLQPLLSLFFGSKKTGRTLKGTKDLLLAIYGIPVCIVTSIYSAVSYTAFAMANFLEHAATLGTGRGRQIGQGGHGKLLDCKLISNGRRNFRL